MKNSVSFDSELSKFGMGLFETIKVVDKKPICIDMHLERMLDSSRILNINIKYTKDDLKYIVDRYIIDNKITTKAIRITVFDEGYNISQRDIIYNKDLYDRGFKLLKSPIKRGDSIIYKHKTTNYFENIYTKKYSNSKGFDDGIFTDLNENILECSMSNIFFIKEKVVYTPHSKLPILNGIMKKRIVALCGELNIEVVENDIKITDIKKFEGCFVSNSLMGIMKVTQIEDFKYESKNELFDYLWRSLKCQK